MAERTGELRRDVAELLDRVEALEQDNRFMRTILIGKATWTPGPDGYKIEVENVTDKQWRGMCGHKDTATGEQAPIYPIRESSGDFTISPYPEEQSSAGAKDGAGTK